MKQILHRLSLSEQRFTLLEHGAKKYAVMMLNVEGRIVKWTAGAERLLGYTEKEIIGEYFSRFYQAEDIWNGKHHHALRTVLATGRFKDNGLRLRKDGTFFYASVTLIPFYNESGNLSGFMKLLCDRTEHEEEENKLPTSEERYHRLFEESGVGCYVSSPDGSIFSCNLAFVQMFGFISVADARQANIADFFQNAAAMQKVFQPLHEHRKIQHAVLQLHHKSKGTVAVIASAFGKFDKAGALTEIHGCFLESAKQKRLEEPLDQVQNIKFSNVPCK